jgi:hypothetical protein
MITKRNRTPRFSSVLAASIVLLAAACTIRTPSTETPPPVDATDNTGIEKTFFESMSQIQVQGENKNFVKRRTFLCGWAPISETGQIASTYLTHAVIMTNHCNMEFEITQNALIGRLVNPSFPDGSNPAHRNRWKEALVIPISNHYYYERAKDSYGRDTNEFIKNSARSHYSARPLMDLAFDRINIQDWDLAMFGGSRSGQITKVDEIEWDKQNGFFAFTASIQDPSWGAWVGARIRFNFKAFEHNENFTPTPYNTKNSNYLNALHVIGEKREGVNQVWSAAKWDLSKTTDIYLHGFPKAYEPLAQETIDQWNQVFAKIDQTKKRPPAFRLNKKPMRYAFDLRYPMMVWVDDRQISEVSPLGIGMAAADVRNGQILWGQITMYGGYLEAYVKGYLQSTGSSDTSSQFAILGSKLDKSSIEKANLVPKAFETYFNHRGLTPLSNVMNTNMSANGMSGLMQNSINSYFADKAVKEQKEIETRTKNTATGATLSEARKRADLNSRNMAETMMESYRKTLQDIQHRSARADFGKGHHIFGFPKIPSQSDRMTAFGEDDRDLRQEDKLRRLNYNKAEFLQRITSGVVHDLDRRFVDVAPLIAEGIVQSGVGYEEGLKRVVKELILHEFGHLLGLGHQFKENILPAKGSVPEKYISELEKRAANGMTNATSVMGYRHPVTELLTPYSDIAPGYQDELTLRYLYNMEYPTFRKNSDDQDFKFAKLPASGLIPDRDPKNPEYQTAYFPQCNDFHATFSSDPYCNRFDRGFDADSIVSSYFDDLNINKVSRIHAFTDARGFDPEYAESALWYNSLRTLGRIRIFYDYMRQKFEPEIRTISQSKRDLDEFSRVCRGEIQGSASLENIFKQKPELKELCRVNRKAVLEITNLLNTPGPDRTRMKWDNASISAQVVGGDGSTDYSSVFGTYSTLSVFPLKISAINALTTPHPYTMLGGWMFPIPRFVGQDGLFSYSTLYSREFTAALASALEKNIKTEPKNGESASIGIPVLSLGHFLDQQAMGNDAIRLPKDFVESLRNQSQFRLSLKAVIIEMQNRGDATRVTQLVGTLFDPYSNKASSLSQVFMLPGGKLIVRGQSRNFIYPISKQPIFLDNKTAFMWAYHIEYDKAHDDVLAAHSVKTKLEDLHKSALDACIRGDNDGLESFFSSQEAKFEGFFVMDGIASDQSKQIKFLESVNEIFQAYYKLRTTADGKGPTQERCERALDGVGVIVSAAALLNGYWLPEVLDQLATK